MFLFTFSEHQLIVQLEKIKKALERNTGLMSSGVSQGEEVPL